MPIERINSLQICRAFAAILVLLYHFSLDVPVFLGRPFLGSFFSFGHAGVSFFFVLSGFIICYSNWPERGKGFSYVKPYLLKRLVRIFPAYWPVLVITVLFYLYFSHYAYDSEYKVTISANDLVKNFLLMSYDKNPIVLIAWTLQLELLFYAIFAIIIMHFYSGLGFFLVWFTAILLFNFGIFTSSSPFIKLLCNYFNLQFLLGCFAAYFVNQHKKYIDKPIMILMLAIMSFILCGYIENEYVKNGDNSVVNLIYALCSFFIILALVKIESLQTITYPRVLLLFGAASYSLYLTHKILLSLLFRLAQRLVGGPLNIIQFNLISLSILCACLGFACLYHKLYEIPALSFFRHLLLTGFKRPRLMSSYR